MLAQSGSLEDLIEAQHRLLQEQAGNSRTGADMHGYSILVGWTFKRPRVASRGKF